MPTNFSEAKEADTKNYSKFFWQLLENGIYVVPSQFETNFVSVAHTEKDFQETSEKICQSLVSVFDGECPMSLKGNTATMPLDELLRFLDGRKSTGTLELIRGNAWKRLYFERGRIISSGSSEPSEYLGHFLISEKKITEEQLTEALEVQKRTKVMLGKILVMIGAVSEEELLLMLENKCKESVFMMFLWEDAEFEFFDNQLPAVRLIPTSMEVEPVVLEGLKRRDEWRLLKEMYPSRQMIFAKSQETTGQEPMSDPFVDVVYQLVNGERSISDIVIHSHGTEYRVLHALNWLKEKGFVQISNYGQKTARVMSFCSECCN